jgi:hypothetical protein
MYQDIKTYCEINFPEWEIIQVAYGMQQALSVHENFLIGRTFTSDDYNQILIFFASDNVIDIQLVDPITKVRNSIMNTPVKSGLTLYNEGSTFSADETEYIIVQIKRKK